MTSVSRRMMGAWLLAGLAVANVAAAHDDRSNDRGALYTMSNAASGNTVQIFDRSSDGRLTWTGMVPTGGLGTGAGLGNQGALALDEEGERLYVVNAGSNNLSVFAVREHGLRLLQTISSGGTGPVSVTVDDDVLYALNASSDTISGFRITRSGWLRPIPGSTRPLSGAGAGAAQIAFSPDGGTLVITEKATNKLTLYAVDPYGRAAPSPTVIASAGATPFGFAFNGRRQLIVSEAFGGAAGKSAVSSYLLRRDGSLRVVSPSVGNGQAAACWIAVTPNRRFAYTTNTASGNISGYRAGPGGTLLRFDDGGITADLGAGSGPIDMAVTPSGDFLYALNGGNQTISLMRVKADGSLVLLQSTSGVPAGANGLAVR